MRPYDLLLGLLAIQLRLVSRGSLAAFARQIAEQPDARLPEYLSEQQAMRETDHALLLRIVDSIVHAHHGDIESALETFGGVDTAQDVFTSPIRTPGFDPASSDAETILAEELPHGLPHQVTPETIGRYTGGSEYARGGIGRILLVHDEQIGRDIILKELLPERLVSPTDSTLSKLPTPDSPGSPMRQSAAMMARFLQEAKITGQLEHPSIVPVYELGLRTDGQLYYTMKLVRGETLATAIKACKTLDDRLRLLRSYLDVCQAMAYAHSKHVIHRDLKPSNIMVGEFGECVVLDWGLAKVQKGVDAHREAMERTASQLQLDPAQLDGINTRSKDVMGTPLYMSPEQARGEIETVGVHSDVYSLGVILYEILTGDLPHPWSNTLDTVRRVGAVPAPPVRKAAPQTPAELAAICDKALQFEAKDRYPSARELEKDVEHFLAGAVVEAYSYSAADMIRRLYQRHKVLIRTVGTAAMTVLAIGVVSYISIYRARDDALRAQAIAEEQRAIAVENEREAETQRQAAVAARARAETAEERTAREKYVSDIRLADAYLRDFKFQAAEDTLLATDPEYRAFEWGYLMAQCHQDLATLGGHTNTVFKTFYSPDGNTIVTVSGDQSAKLWDALSYEEIHVWHFPGLWLRHATFNPVGDTLAICLTDGSVRMMDPVTGEERLALTGHSAPVNYCAFSSDGKQLLTASSDRFVKLWDIESRAVLLTLPEHSGEIKSVGFGDGERTIYSRTADEVIHLFDVEGGAEKAAAPGMGVDESDDGALLFARQNDRAIVYSGADLRELISLEHDAPVTCQQAYPELGWLLTGCEDGNLRLWRYPEGTLERTFILNAPPRACAMSPDGLQVAAMASNGLGMTWDVVSGASLSRFGGHRGAVARLQFSPSGELLLSCAMDGTARLWDPNHTPWRTTVYQASGDTTIATASPDAASMVFGSLNGMLEVLDLRSRRLRYRATVGETLWSDTVAVDPAAERLALVADSFLPLVVNLTTGEILTRLRGHEGYIGSITFNQTGSELVTAGWDKTARVWNADTGETLAILTGHSAPLTYAQFSPSGTYVATTSRDKTARVYGRDSGELQFSITHEASVGHCAFSPDSTLLATASDDGTVQIWDIAQKTIRTELRGQMYGVTSVEFLEDDARVLTASEDGSVRLWDTESGTQLFSVEGFSGRLVHAGASSRPGNLYVTTHDGILTELAGLVPSTSAPPTTVAELAPLVAALQEKARARIQRPSVEQNVLESQVFLPEGDLSSALSAIMAAASGTANGIVHVDEALARTLWRLGLHAGDRIIALNGVLPAVYQPGPGQGSAPTLVDALQGDRPLRLRLTPVPAVEENVRRELPHAQATALLREAQKILQGNTEAILQVSRRWAAEHHVPLEAPDSLPGLVINDLGEGIGQALLEAAGLQAQERVIAFNGEPVTSLSQLIARCADGLRYLEENESFELNLRLQRGGYETRTVTLIPRP